MLKDERIQIDVFYAQSDQVWFIFVRFDPWVGFSGGPSDQNFGPKPGSGIPLKLISVTDGPKWSNFGQTDKSVVK